MSSKGTKRKRSDKTETTPETTETTYTENGGVRVSFLPRVTLFHGCGIISIYRKETSETSRKPRYFVYFGNQTVSSTDDFEDLRTTADVEGIRAIHDCSPPATLPKDATTYSVNPGVNLEEVSPDGSHRFNVVSVDNRFHFSINEGECDETMETIFEGEQDGKFSGAAFSHDNELCAVASNNNRNFFVTVRNVKGKGDVYRFSSTTSINSLCFSPCGNLLALWSNSRKEIYCYSMKSILSSSTTSLSPTLVLSLENLGIMSIISLRIFGDDHFVLVTDIGDLLIDCNKTPRLSSSFVVEGCAIKGDYNVLCQDNFLDFYGVFSKHPIISVLLNREDCNFTLLQPNPVTLTLPKKYHKHPETYIVTVLARILGVSYKSKTLVVCADRIRVNNLGWGWLKRST